MRWVSGRVRGRWRSWRRRSLSPRRRGPDRPGCLSCSSLCLLLAEPTNVEDHDRHDGDQEDDGQRAGDAEVVEVEELVVILDGDDVGAEVAAGHNVDDVEDLEQVDDHGGGD